MFTHLIDAWNMEHITLCWLYCRLPI